MPNTFIGRVIVQPDAPRPGESCRVEVLAPEDKPVEGTGIAVTINGVPGAIQHLQFPTAGARGLHVRAVGAGGSENQTVTVNVQGVPLTFTGLSRQPDIAMLATTQSPAEPYVAILTLGTSVDVRTPVSLSPVDNTPTIIERIQATEAVSRLSNAGALARALSANASAVVRMAGNSRVHSRIGNASSTKRRLGIKTSASVFNLGELDINEAIAQPGTGVQPLYEWDFGDGNTATTRSPMVAHDFFAAMNHPAGASSFHVQCRLVHEDITVTRTLTIQSAYELCKRKGAVVPHVTGELFANKRYTNITGSFTVHNIEDEPMVLNALSVTAITEDADSVALPNPLIPLGSEVIIGPRSSSVIGLNIPFVAGTPGPGQLPHQLTGFTAVYAGTCGDYPVRCGATFDIPLAEWDSRPSIPELDEPELVRVPWPWEQVITGWQDEIINPAVGITSDVISLDEVSGTVAVALGNVADVAGRRSMATLADKVLSGIYAPMEMKTMSAGQVAQPQLLTTRRAPRVGSERALSSIRMNPNVADHVGIRTQNVLADMAPPSIGMIAEGQICDPDNLTEEELARADEGQLVCQLTNEVRDVLMPARWMNARKGDIILSPGGDGMIGGLLVNVEPPQWYSHTGIMTRNYDEITHSTASAKRLKDRHAGWTADGTDGLEPKSLKYMWPGAITQTVQASIEGEPFPDPEHADKTYSLSAFGKQTVGVTHNDRMVMIPPLVIKPDPMQETPAVRATLHGIASDARADGGRPRVPSRYHYSFYAYTDPTPGKGAPAGLDAGWAVGTRPSCCSSFIWLKAEGRGVHLETSQALVTPTDLEQTDVDNGASVRPTTPDGLYTYTAKERMDAANWLWNDIHNQAFDQAGWLGEALTDAADDNANQVINMFANGDADGKDSEEWKNLGPSDTVSPDNMMWWDAPANGGVYGYVEPAIYREPRIESYTISKWKKVLTRGTIRGRVFADGGAPLAGAIVQVYEGKTAFTGGDGSYTIADVPIGSYGIKASKVIDGSLQSAQRTIELAGDLTVDITLQPPADRYRVAQVFVDFWGSDYETVGDNEIHDPGPEYFELELGPDKLINSSSRTYKWGGELRMEYSITARLLVGNVIDVSVQGTMYEGTDEENDDLDGQGGVGFQVGVGATAGSTLTITNTDEDDDDTGVFSVSVKNVRNDN